MKNYVSINLKKDEILIKLNEDAERNDIIEGLKKKLQELKKLYKDEKTKISKVVDENYIGGKLSKLNYEVIGYDNDKTIVKINLITGRHHQIRLQFKNLGYPLYGDQLYGKINKKQIKLYAYKLEFNHPVTKKRLVFKLLPNWKELENETIIHRL